MIKKGKIKKLESLDIGHLIPVNQHEIINLFKSIKWLKNSNNINFYGTGGSFRSLGSAYIKNTNYPLYLIHGLSIKTENSVLLLDKIMDAEKEISWHSSKSYANN